MVMMFIHQWICLKDKVRMCALIVAGILLAFGGPAVADESKTITFLGQEIIAAPGTYLVRKDVNIRSLPKTSGKRLGKFEDGTVIDVAGRVPKSEWFAAVDGGEPIGFVFGSVLSPIIDGQVDEDVTGEVQVGPGLRCGFRIIFMAKTGGEGGLIRTSDYEATIVCERKSLRVRFPAQMFITEEPFNGSKKSRIFQINVDLLDGLHDLDDIFSTITLFDLDKAQVRFDKATEPTFIGGENPAEARPAESVEEALAAALEIALILWSPVVWDEIFDRAG
jgi:hypothetical protein